MTTDGSAMRAVVEVVARALVDRPDEVQVTESARRGMTVVELSTAPGDMGKIIGRQGNTAKSIRTLLRVVGMKNNSRVNLKINEPVGGLKSAERMSGEGSAMKSVDEAMADLKLE